MLAEQQPQRGRRSAGPRSATMSATRKSSQPELSPRGAEIEPQRAAVEEQPRGHAGLAQQPLHPAVLDGLEPVAPARRLVEVGSPGRATRTSSCQGDAPSAGSSSRTAKSGRSVSP